MSAYGRPHRRRVAELEQPNGALCPFCRLPMWPGQRLHADHVIPVAVGGGDGPLRWSHAKCNEAAGARLGNTLRANRRRRWVDRWA